MGGAQCPILAYVKARFGFAWLRLVTALSMLQNRIRNIADVHPQHNLLSYICANHTSPIMPPHTAHKTIHTQLGRNVPQNVVHVPHGSKGTPNQTVCMSSGCTGKFSTQIGYGGHESHENTRVDPAYLADTRSADTRSSLRDSA